jgi:superfamily I DNA/RNA helicase
MLTKMAERGAFITAVGDRRQAIYGFRGALSNSMDLLSKTFEMTELPLSITYRCALAIVAEAQQIVPQIQAREGAPEGLVQNLEDYPEISSYKTGDLIICRNNGPIFSLAIQFLRAKLPCRVFSNFLDELEKFILSFDAKSMSILISRLEDWFSKHKKDCEERGAWGKLEGIQDKYSVVRAFANEFTDINKMLYAIRSLVTSQVGPRISTIHRAKGLEADTVYLLRYDLLPSSRATTAEQIAQEENLKYVAITRAKNNLFILPLGED